MRDTGLFTRTLKQTATLWERDGVDAGGDPSFASGTPRQISCRWEWRTVVYFSSSGEERQSKAVVMVAEDLAEGDYLYLGTSAAESPVGLDGAFEVRGFDKIPDINGEDFERRVYL